MNVAVAPVGSVIARLEEASEAKDVELRAEADVPPVTCGRVTAWSHRALGAIRAEARDEVRRQRRVGHRQPIRRIQRGRADRLTPILAESRLHLVGERKTVVRDIETESERLHESA